MRLAWFSPWPPQQSGIAGRSAELVPALCRRGLAIDVFVDAQHVPVTRLQTDQPPEPGEHRVQSAHEFVWRMRRGQYDLVVYQIGNSRLHEFIWPYLYRWPGLTVLHDARLHHARGRARLLRRQFREYRAEFRWNHPDTSPDIAELGVAGFDGPYYFLWPMLRGVVESSRAMATHARGALDELRAIDTTADRPVEYIALGEGRDVPFPPPERRAERARLGLTDCHVAFGLFGGLTADKRLGLILRCFDHLRHRLPDVRLVLAGTSSSTLDLNALISTQGLSDVVTRVNAPDDESFDRLISAVDVSLNLRWPSAIETSGPWLRALAAGRASIVTALAHQAHVPAIDPRTWLPWPGQPLDTPVTVAIDILDEAHSLGLAMSRLAEDAGLRASLGAAARRYWEREHTLTRMADDYERATARTAAAPLPTAMLPPVLRSDPLAPIRTWLEPFGITLCEFN